MRAETDDWSSIMILYRYFKQYLSCTASKSYISFVLYIVHSFDTALLFVEGLMLMYVRYGIVKLLNKHF